MEFLPHIGPMPALNARSSSAGHTPGLDLRMLSPLSMLISPARVLPESSPVGPLRVLNPTRQRRASAPSKLSTAAIAVMLARTLQVQGKRRRTYNLMPPATSRPVQIVWVLRRHRGLRVAAGR